MMCLEQGCLLHHQSVDTGGARCGPGILQTATLSLEVAPLMDILPPWRLWEWESASTVKADQRSTCRAPPLLSYNQLSTLGRLGPVLQPGQTEPPVLSTSLATRIMVSLYV